MDKLQEMWDQQRKFMELLQVSRNFPEFPFDMTSKFGQKYLKGITHVCMHELFEANQVLKNSKDHRITDVKDFDRAHYTEELVDALHYFFEIALLSGISVEELYEAYMKKGEVNINRIESGY